MYLPTITGVPIYNLWKQESWNHLVKLKNSCTSTGNKNWKKYIYEYWIFTLTRSMEINIELLHAIIDHLYLVVAHHPKKPKMKKLTIKKWTQKRLKMTQKTVKRNDSFIKSISRRLLGEDMIFFYNFGSFSLPRGLWGEGERDEFLVKPREANSDINAWKLKGDFEYDDDDDDDDDGGEVNFPTRTPNTSILSNCMAWAFSRFLPFLSDGYFFINLNNWCTTIIYNVSYQ